MAQAVQSTRPGGSISYVGVPHGVELDGAVLFYTHVHLHGGPAPVRRYLPKLIELVDWLDANHEAVLRFSNGIMEAGKALGSLVAGLSAALVLGRARRPRSRHSLH